MKPSTSMTREKTDHLQDYLNKQILSCPNTLQSFKETLPNSAIYSFHKKKNRFSLVKSDEKMITLLKSKHLNQQKIRGRVYE